ncbi:ribonuclease domain-containing protein [Corynebacterium breve]|uniref:Ribonuclease domain-containing protein n=1 Tax=Corynebacterium breve TaxID=3049799 RepID=A0ABY8VFS3_9CORY|nr:ribonuclease domain-containing protein [Corynebacterium breve]WIM67069.1 ribonuclease domain-containing protein [Corynebacterium breve]
MASSGQKGRKTVPSIIASVALLAVAGIFGFNNLPDEGETTPKTQVSSASDACSTLPDEAYDTIDDIYAGGPFEYPDNDGSRFGNYEGVLPDEKLGYYREYTVETPGLSHRGAKRIVTGGDPAHDPDVFYYTDDHYETFCEVTDA